MSCRSLSRSLDMHSCGVTRCGTVSGTESQAGETSIGASNEGIPVSWGMRAIFESCWFRLEGVLMVECVLIAATHCKEQMVVDSGRIATD